MRVENQNHANSKDLYQLSTLNITLGSIFKWINIQAFTGTQWKVFVCLMVFNATFNNISVISWRSVLLMEEPGGPGENHRPVASHWQTLPHNVVHFALIEIRTHNISVVISTDCIGSGKSNYHTTTTAPKCHCTINKVRKTKRPC